MSNSNDQYKSIPIEFWKADFGYSKMGRCVTFILPKSEAARLGVRVGWLELKVERRTMSNPKKRWRNKSKSRSQTYLVHFLVPRRRIFCKVVWKALASTHCKMDHPQRKIVGSVELGIVLWVVDIVKNRALVACPKTGWNPDVSGWLPDAPFAWLSMRAKDGTDILKNISESELYTSIRSSTLSRPSGKKKMYARSHSSISTRMQRPAIHNAARSRSHYSGRKLAIPLDFRENKLTTKLSHLTPSPIQVDRVMPCDSTSGEHLTTSSREHSQKVFIDLEFKETKENPTPENYIPLDFRLETALADDVDSQIKTSLGSGTNSKISLTRSKTLQDSYIAEVQVRTKGQDAQKPGDSHSPEKRASVSYSDTKLSSKMDSMSMSRWTKLSEEEILSRSTTDSKHAMGKDYLSVPIPGTKLEADEIESRVERRSLTESTLIASSFESKYTSRSSKLSHRRCVFSEKESTRKQKIKEIETYAKWLAQGYETPLSSHKREDETLSGRTVKHYTDENVKQRSKGVIEPISLKKPRNQVYDGTADSGIFSIYSEEEPLASDNMNAPFRFEVEREAREKHRLGHLICSADV